MREMINNGLSLFLSLSRTTNWEIRSIKSEQRFVCCIVGETIEKGDTEVDMKLHATCWSFSFKTSLSLSVLDCAQPNDIHLDIEY